MRGWAALLALAFAVMAAAQTTVPPGMLRRWGGGTLDDLRLYAVAVDGVAQVRIGPGLRLEERGGALVLSAEAASLRIVSRVLVQDGNGNYVCPRCERVYRNGIRMAQGVDYATNPNGILPLQPWAADDVVLGEWIGTEEPAEPLTAALLPAAMVRNWRQVSPNELIPVSDPRRRPGVALSQVATPPACTWWYAQRIRYAAVLGKSPPLRIDCSGDGLAAFWGR